jgi:hypothetical protein
MSLADCPNKPDTKLTVDRTVASHPQRASTSTMGRSAGISDRVESGS